MQTIATPIDSAAPSAPDALEGSRERVRVIIDQIEGSMRAFRCLGTNQLLQAGVSMTHLHVIWQLQGHGDELSMGRLAELLGVSLSNATGLIDRMEERGLVERVRLTDDRRTVHVRPTEAGRRAVQTMELVRADLMDDVLAQLDADQLDRLAQALDDWAGALDEVVTTRSDHPEAILRR